MTEAEQIKMLRETLEEIKAQAPHDIKYFRQDQLLYRLEWVGKRADAALAQTAQPAAAGEEQSDSFLSKWEPIIKGTAPASRDDPARVEEACVEHDYTLDQDTGISSCWRCGVVERRPPAPASPPEGEKG